MSEKKKKTIAPVSKPFVKGGPTDEMTFKKAAAHFGMLVATAVLSFLVCSMTGVESVVLRLIMNLLVVAVILMIFSHRGVNDGTDAVARGEILYQRLERQQAVSESEKTNELSSGERICERDSGNHSDAAVRGRLRGYRPETGDDQCQRH